MQFGRALEEANKEAASRFQEETRELHEENERLLDELRSSGKVSSGTSAEVFLRAEVDRLQATNEGLLEEIQELASSAGGSGSRNIGADDGDEDKQRMLEEIERLEAAKKEAESRLQEETKALYEENERLLDELRSSGKAFLQNTM